MTEFLILFFLLLIIINSILLLFYSAYCQTILFVKRRASLLKRVKYSIIYYANIYSRTPIKRTPSGPRRGVRLKGVST